MDTLDDIWRIAEEQLEILKDKSVSTIPPDNNECKHINTNVDTTTSDVVCEECGVVLGRNISMEAEWNNYKDDSGNYSRNTQRGDLYVTDNPYAIGSTRCGLFKNNNSLGAKLHLQQCFSHKQRTFWQVSQIFENICSKHCAGKSAVLVTAKELWHICMESGKLTRASVREGLIACCLYYSCIYNKTPISRNDIIKFFCCDTRTLTKGEKVFYSIIETVDRFRHLTKETVDVEENDSFVRYCNILGMEWKVAMICNEVFNKNKQHLTAVTPKSATCGVIVYVIKKKLELKYPTKSELSNVLNVCTPTINKVVDILCKNN